MIWTTKLSLGQRIALLSCLRIAEAEGIAGRYWKPGPGPEQYISEEVIKGLMRDLEQSLLSDPREPG